jgi:hypothetical protein
MKTLYSGVHFFVKYFFLSFIRLRATVQSDKNFRGRGKAFKKLRAGPNNEIIKFEIFLYGGHGVLLPLPPQLKGII